MDDTCLSPATLRMLGLTRPAPASQAQAPCCANSPASTSRRRRSNATPRHWGAKSPQTNATSSTPKPCDASTLYLGLDGTGVPARPTEVADRAGKQPDGAARTREAKLAVVWSADTTDKEGRPVRDRDSATYNAAIETIATRDTDNRARPVRPAHPARGRAPRLRHAPRHVVLGDGAPWIWNFADEHFPDAVQIVDIFHAKGHVFEVAKALYGPGSEFGEQWAKQQRDALDEGRVDDVIGALRGHADTCEAARRDVEYFANNRERMNYPKFRAMGLCVATGVVEGGCKHIIGTRLKRGGMRWSVAGANAIIALRCARREPPLRRLLGTSCLRIIMQSHKSDVHPLPLAASRSKRPRRRADSPKEFRATRRRNRAGRNSRRRLGPPLRAARGTPPERRSGTPRDPGPGRATDKSRDRRIPCRIESSG